ncbi:helix-turn-helix domain-containing protein, partial [Salmonella enterica subsp. enterica]|nr:helix-turn-helix domain-containing protein [Salmonella enterica subsp. enterica]
SRQYYRCWWMCRWYFRAAGDVPRQQVAIIYDVGLSTLYRKFPAGYR